MTWGRKGAAVHMLLQKSFKKQMGLVMSWVCVTTEQENLQQRLLVWGTCCVTEAACDSRVCSKTQESVLHFTVSELCTQFEIF